MKKLFMAVSLGLVISSGFAQGIFNFDNSANFGDPSLLPTITSGGAPGEGSLGQVIGSDPTFATPNYDITYFWMLGTPSAQQFSLGATQGAVAHFDAHTGDTFGGAGVVEGGIQSLPGVAGGTLITIQLFAWCDPTGSGALPGHDPYFNYPVNVGWSQLETITLAAPGSLNVPDIRSIPAFTLTEPIPEPSIPAFAGVGAAALAFVHSRKSKFSRPLRVQ